MTRVRARITRRHSWRKWIDDALPIALGPLEMTHGAFYHMTPREFHQRLDGWTWRRRRREEFFAKWVAQLISPHIKGKVTPEQLLNRPIGDPPKLEKKATP